MYLFTADSVHAIEWMKLHRFYKATVHPLKAFIPEGQLLPLPDGIDVRSRSIAVVFGDLTIVISASITYISSLNFPSTVIHIPVHTSSAPTHSRTELLDPAAQVHDILAEHAGPAHRN